jgi:hypothetical protein
MLSGLVSGTQSHKPVDEAAASAPVPVVIEAELDQE